MSKLLVTFGILVGATAILALDLVATITRYDGKMFNE